MNGYLFCLGPLVVNSKVWQVLIILLLAHGKPGLICRVIPLEVKGYPQGA